MCRGKHCDDQERLWLRYTAAAWSIGRRRRRSAAQATKPRSASPWPLAPYQPSPAVLTSTLPSCLTRRPPTCPPCIQRPRAAATASHLGRPLHAPFAHASFLGLGHGHDHDHVGAPPSAYLPSRRAPGLTRHGRDHYHDVVSHSRPDGCCVLRATDRRRWQEQEAEHGRAQAATSNRAQPAPARGPGPPQDTRLGGGVGVGRRSHCLGIGC